ncbi:MAG: hypothetical protein SVS85_02225, partial [Candidatus Nanohaloarchaea archaeon]|nr:hypothetical protein [Candidatus Nanohaloarchaea archaeon]
MLPEGDYIYEDLSSDFADTDQLLEELKEKKVTGYLKFENENEKGFTILERGVPGKMKIVRNSHEEIRNGDSLSEVLEEGSYTVEVVDCNESGREIVQIKLENEEIKSDISTGEVDISQFLSTNITDQENDCHIIMISGGDTGVITMSDGLPRQAKFSTSGEIMVG